MPTDFTVPITDARGQLAELVNRVAYSGDHVTLTRHGRPMAVLVSVSDAQRSRGAADEPAQAEAVSSLTPLAGHTPEEIEHRYPIAARTTTPAPRSAGRPGTGPC